MKIVKKCKGLPLALETIGSLLYTKSSVSEWESVLISEIWDLPKEDSKIIPALFLSYYHLPSHLKRCFAYCALFPKDYEFDKESLVLLWMAENFLHPQQNKSPEEVGEQYFNDLLSRSFFQQSNEWHYKWTFVMHDLLNDLAKFVSGDICFRFGVDKPEGIPKIRHFLFVTDDDQSANEFGNLCYPKSLRTYMHMHQRVLDGEISGIHDLFPKFKFLRVLSLTHWPDLEEVPDFVGNLKLLRSLDLSNSRIRKLPDSTCFLYSLQVLKLNNCEYLEELPLNLHKLTNLHRLELVYTDLKKVPMHLGKLKNLQVLMTSFRVGKSRESGIQQLGKLNLRGSLAIEDLQNIVNPVDALAADLKNKKYLLDLVLEWNQNQNLEEDSAKEREVLDNLQPFRHLEYLSINNYGGTQFPSWLDNSLSNLVSLTLKNCKYCVCLPPLGLLPLLKHLTITGLDSIVRIDTDFHGSISSSFTSLETLKFEDMKEWEEWNCKDVTGAFPRIHSLSIQRCPKFKWNLPQQLFHLKNLKFDGNEPFVIFSNCMIPDLGSWNLQPDYHRSTLKRLVIKENTMEVSLLERIGHLIFDASLGYLHIYSSPKVNIPMDRCFDFLVEVEIKNSCESLTTFPLDFFPKLSKLALEVEFSGGGLPSNLKEMELLYCSKLFDSMKGVLGANNSVKTLSISGMDMESFPDEGLLPLSLTSLEIYFFMCLERLDYKGLCQLNSLEELLLSKCEILSCLPEEGLPKSISTIRIWNCRLLKPRLKKPEGEDWKKIAHIENIDVD
ncbi:putative disease resistance RPP13-like protein 1, partial [Mucuna pruriens]